MISQRSGGSRSASGVQLGTGRGTLRLRSKGPATVEQLVSVDYTRRLITGPDHFVMLPEYVWDLVHFSPLHLRKRPLRRWMTCWRATWASETASWVCVLHYQASELVCVTVFFVCTKCSLTSRPILSGHHGGAGKGQKEP